MNIRYFQNATKALTVALACCCLPAYADLLLDVQYESGLANDGNPMIGLVQPSDEDASIPERITATQNFSRHGGWALRTELRHGEYVISSARAECNHRDLDTVTPSSSNPVIPTIELCVKRYYGFSVLLSPETNDPAETDPLMKDHWIADKNGTILFQAKQPGGGSPSFLLYADKRRSSEGGSNLEEFKFAYQNIDSGSQIWMDVIAERGIWYDAVLELLPAYNTGDGILNFYFKKAGDSTYTQYTVINQGNTILYNSDGYIKWGIYKNTWYSRPDGYPGDYESLRRVVYHDNIRVATTFAEADPSVDLGQQPPVVTLTLAISPGSNPQVSFPTETGITYQLQKSADMAAGTWSDVSGQWVAGDGNQQILVDPDGNPASGEGAFYRVLVNWIQTRASLTGKVE